MVLFINGGCERVNGVCVDDFLLPMGHQNVLASNFLTEFHDSLNYLTYKIFCIA